MNRLLTRIRELRHTGQIEHLLVLLDNNPTAWDFVDRLPLPSNAISLRFDGTDITLVYAHPKNGWPRRLTLPRTHGVEAHEVMGYKLRATLEHWPSTARPPRYHAVLINPVGEIVKR